MDNRPIGVFDSGMGGLSVWRVLRNTLRSESLVFFGDGLNCPYGARPAEEVCQLTSAAVRRLIEEESCKMIVVACNTATAAAIRYLRETWQSVPFVGLEPAVKPAALSSKTGVIGVLATERSLAGDHFRRTSAQYADMVRIIPVVGQRLVEIVENDMETSAEAEAAVRRVVEPLIDEGIDRLVLGCTHYPFLRSQIERVVGQHDIAIIDSADAVERRVEQLLDENGLRADDVHIPEYKFLSCAGEEYVCRLQKKAMK